MTQIQDIVLAAIILGFAGLELASRRENSALTRGGRAYAELEVDPARDTPALGA